MSREWRQVYCGDNHIAQMCNRLDGEGWSIHSVIQTKYVSADYPEEKAVTILAWRAVFVEPTKPVATGYRE